MSDYTFWRAVLAGQKPETRLPHQPEAGYFRRKRNDRDYREMVKDGRAKGVAWSTVAFWQDGGEWQCACQHGFEPRQLDEICELFASVCRDAITYETYASVMEGKPWPEEVAERPAPERIGPTETQAAMYGQGKSDERGIGDNSGDVEPFALMSERVKDVNGQIAAWLKEIGGKVTTQEQADKASNFSILLGELEKESVAAHKTAKEPWLEGGRKVDAAWKPVITLAEESKKRVKMNVITPFLVEQQRKADEAAKAERERIARERDISDDAPAPIVETPKVKAGNRDGKGVSLRTVKSVEVFDIKAVAAFYANFENPPPDFVEVLRKLADRSLKAGVDVPGARHVESKVAA